MARYHITDKTEIEKKVCECGKGFIVKYKIIEESDDTPNEKISYSLENECSLCSKNNIR